MRKLVYWVHQSVDGFIEGPNGEFDWPEMGPDLSEYSFELTDRADAFLYGRKVWELMSYFWPRAEQLSQHPHNVRFAPVWRRTPKVVISRTLEKVEDDARVIGRDLAAEVAELKAQPGGELLLTGGSGAAACAAPARTATAAATTQTASRMSTHYPRAAGLTPARTPPRRRPRCAGRRRPRPWPAI